MLLGRSKGIEAGTTIKIGEVIIGQPLLTIHCIEVMRLSKRKNKKLTCRMFITVNEQTILWYEIDENGQYIWHLPKEKTEEYVERVLKQVGQKTSAYAGRHAEKSLWGKEGT